MIEKLVLIRHGQTEWAKLGRHTGTTDLPLTEQGVLQAKTLGERLSREGSFTSVLASPLRRALETSKLAGFAATIDPNLTEWNYGAYEGMTTPQIQQKAPAWCLFRDGAPGGETPQDVAARADAVLKQLSGTPLLFSSAHFLRILAARFLGLPPETGKSFLLSPASVSVLGYEHKTPVIILWNDIDHLVYS